MDYTRPRSNHVTFINDRHETITLHLRSADLAERIARDKGGTVTKEST